MNRRRTDRTKPPRADAGSPASGAELRLLLQSASLLLADEQAQEALQLLQPSLSEPGPSSQVPDERARLYRLAAQALIASGSPTIALDLIRRARRQFPRDASFLGLQARVYLLLGRRKRAEKLAIQALEYDFADCEAHVALADARLQDESWEEAAAHCRLVLQVEPGRRDALRILLTCLLRLGLIEEAMSVWRSAIRPTATTNSADHLLGIASMLRQFGHLKEAEEVLQDVLQICGDDGRVHIMLSDVLLESGKTDECIVHARSALRFEAQCVAAAYNLLAMAHLRNGSFHEALQAARSAVQAAPLDPLPRFKLAVLYYQKGDLANAAEQYERLLAFNPGPDLIDESQAALSAIEQYQFQEVIMRCSEDPVFRIKLQRDAAPTLSEYGYAASGGLVNMVRSVDLTQLPLSFNPKPPRYQ